LLFLYSTTYREAVEFFLKNGNVKNKVIRF